MNTARALLSASIVVFGFCNSAGSEQPSTALPANQLMYARQIGWVAAMHFVEQLTTNKQPGFPGIEAWLSDFGRQTKGLDPKRPPEEWPTVDVDALATKNPKFW